MFFTHPDDPSPLAFLVKRPADCAGTNWGVVGSEDFVGQLSSGLVVIEQFLEKVLARNWFWHNLSKQVVL